jgi:hypothetical protein
MLKKLFRISCKRATFLAGKKEAGKTSFFENIKLKLHYKICDGCKLFDKQTTFIGKNAGHIHGHSDITMRREKKEAIKVLLKP